jgi:ABC-type Mn2+/Zn2+ transport system ATPase subunit
MAEALIVKHLTVNYDKTPVLWDIDLSIPIGQIVGVIGPNGAGKTTLLKACLGLQPMLHGKVEFFGLPLEKVRRALMQDADLYLLDEPFSGIDMVSESAIMEILRSLRDKGKTVIVIHHDLDSVKSYFDWLVVLNRSLVASGLVSEVFTPDVLARSYGKSSQVLDDALRLTQRKGVVPK